MFSQSLVRVAVFIGAMMTLSACLGNSDNKPIYLSQGAIKLFVDQDPKTFHPELRGFLNEFDAVNRSAGQTPDMHLRRTGVATYNGKSAFVLEGNGHLIGSARMTADFESRQINGTFGNFAGRTAQGDAVTATGALTTVAGMQGDAGFNGRITGTLTSNGNAMEFDGRHVNAAFSGPNAENMLSTMEGRFTTNGTARAFEGAFFATRN